MSSDLKKDLKLALESMPVGVCTAVRGDSNALMHSTDCCCRCFRGHLTEKKRKVLATALSATALLVPCLEWIIYTWMIWYDMAKRDLQNSLLRTSMETSIVMINIWYNWKLITKQYSTTNITMKSLWFQNKRSYWLYLINTDIYGHN